MSGKRKKPSGRSPAPRPESPGPPWMVYVYGALAVAGLLLPWAFNIKALAAGMDMAQFARGAFANPAAASISVDIFVAAALVASVAFALPLYLMARHRKLSRAAGAGG
ncbi:MAG: DUF2834 domain-containing protein [Deltaproteobacteria bacterium]|nr:DUF2834 domain-containing protein [Deltaproteobacteria bacterium]